MSGPPAREEIRGRLGRAHATDPSRAPRVRAALRVLGARVVADARDTSVRHPDAGLRLAGQPGFQLPAPDPQLSAQLKQMLGADAGGFGIAVLDLSDPAHPRYAESNASRVQNPGSVGKIMVALAWFQALADLYPDDAEARGIVSGDTVMVYSDRVPSLKETILGVEGADYSFAGQMKAGNVELTAAALARLAPPAAGRQLLENLLGDP